MKTYANGGATHTKKRPGPQRGENTIAGCTGNLMTCNGVILGRLGSCQERRALGVVRRHFRVASTKRGKVVDVRARGGKE